MTDNEILNVVKTMLFGTAAASFRDELLRMYINEIKDFMKNAGVANDIITSERSVGVIALGVNDLWNYQAGGVRLSEYFTQRVIQLSREGGEIEPTRKTIKQFTWYLKTTEPETTVVVFDIPQYDEANGDSLNVYVNGMLSIKNVDYTIGGSTITFAIAKIAGTKIFVVVEKLVDDGGV